MNAKDKVKDTALHYSALKGNYAIALNLIESGADLNGKDSDGNTPLDVAKIKGYKGLVDLLKKAEVNAGGSGTEALSPPSTLMEAIHRGNTKAVNALLAQGADVNTKDEKGYTALDFAVGLGRTDAVNALLDRGADKNAKSNDGRTALHYAANEGKSNILQILLNRGADINAKTNDGWTALHYAVNYYGTNPDAVNILLKRGTDINAKNNDGLTALHIAALHRKSDIMHILLDRGADINAKTNDGLTALHFAARDGYADIAKILLDRGADINAKGNSGGIALHYAAYNDNTSVVKLLVEKGTAIDIVDKKGKTPLQVAEEQGHTIIPAILKKADADKKARETLASSANVLPDPKSTPPLRQDNYAIIIGIDYKDRKDIPHLQYASSDAKKVYDILTDPRYGGIAKENTTLLLNEKATRIEIMKALRRIKNLDGYVYLYFTGHGAPKTKGEQFVEGLLVPSDVDNSDPESMEESTIRLSYLQDLIDSSPAKGIMVALDACFSGEGKSIVPKGGKPMVVMQESSGMIRPKSTGKVVITSSSGNQQSWEDEKEIQGGIFSYYLLEGLKGRGGSDAWVKVNDLAEYIKVNVPKAARNLKGVDQTPQVFGKADFAVARNPERSRLLDLEAATEKLKSAFEKGAITAKQLNRANDELKAQTRTRLLDTFLKGEIDAKTFGEMY